MSACHVVKKTQNEEDAHPQTGDLRNAPFEIWREDSTGTGWSVQGSREAVDGQAHGSASPHQPDYWNPKLKKGNKRTYANNSGAPLE